MDKIDGPYYFFKLLQRLRARAARVVPAGGPPGRRDEHRAGRLRRQGDGPHRPPARRRPARATPSTWSNPEPMTVGEALNEFAKAAHAPQLAMRIDQNMTNAIPKPVRAGAHGAADRQADPQPDLPRPGHPAGGDGEPRLPLQVRRARRPARARRAPASRCRRCPPTRRRLWDYWERNLDPDLFRDRWLASAIKGKRILITGASSGIGLETALKIGEAGGEVILVSRTREKLEEVAQAGRGAGRHRPRAPGRPVRPRGHRPAGGRGARGARRRRRADQQRRPLDPPLGEGAPTTASTTTSARCS